MAGLSGVVKGVYRCRLPLGAIGALKNRYLAVSQGTHVAPRGARDGLVEDAPAGHVTSLADERLDSSRLREHTEAGGQFAVAAA